MKKFSKWILVVIMALNLIACNRGESVNEKTSELQVNAEINTSIENLKTFIIQQSDNYFEYQTGMECSGFASAYVLRHFGVDTNGIETYEEMPDKLGDGGVLPSSIVTFFDNNGYDAAYITNGTIEDLKREVSKGVPVIVFIHMEVPYTSCHNTHYLAMVGYDEEYFYFAESVEGNANSKEEKNYNRKMDIKSFEEHWKNIDGCWDNPYFRITKENNE